jgi:DNA polymerase III sliding clamp (beta) subunit (PCNA family)
VIHLCGIHNLKIKLATENEMILTAQSYYGDANSSLIHLEKKKDGTFVFNSAYSAEGTDIDLKNVQGPMSDAQRTFIDDARLPSETKYPSRTEPGRGDGRTTTERV